MKNERIKKMKVSIDEEKTLEFFNDRIEKILPHRYNLINYQDSNPHLALERDRYEKDKIGPFLNIKDDDIVLDIGCGVGRWGDEICPQLNCGRYIGIDYSSSLLKIAQENNQPHSAYYLGKFQHMDKVIAENHLPQKYDKILINGVLMYINDTDIIHCLNLVNSYINDNGIIYIKEGVGIKERFTLKDYYSSELNHVYNAIYRSIDEYHELIQKYLIGNTNRLVQCGETWPKSKQNRSETTNYYFIISA